MLFILWNFLLAGNSFLLIQRFFPSDSIPERSLHFLVLYYSQVLGLLSILAVFGKLSACYITIALFLLFLVLLVFCRQALKRPDFKTPTGALVAYPLLFVICHYATVLYYQVLQPVLTTDGLLYHMPFALNYFKTGRLSFPLLFFTEPSMTYYPPAGDLLYCFALFAGVEPLLNFVQMPFMLMAGLSLYLILKKCGFSTPNCLAGVCVLVLLRPICTQTYLTYVDLMLAGSFLTVLYYFSTGESRKICLGFFAGGLLIGFKNFALIYFFLSAPLLIRYFPKRHRLGILPGLLFCVIIGGFGYLRNLFVLGNPVFPANLTIGSHVIFPGIFQYRSAGFLPSVKHLFFLILHPVSNADPSAWSACFLLLALAVSLILSIRESFFRKYLLWLPLLTIFLYLAAIPSTYYQIRHLLPIYGLLVLALMYVIQRIPKSNWILYGLFPFLGWESLRSGAEPLFWTLFLVAAAVCFFGRKKSRERPALFLLTTVWLFYFFFWHLPVSLAGHSFNKYYLWKRAYRAEGEIWEYVQKNSGSGKNIAYVGSFFLYPLYGPKYQNNVFYQSVNSVETKPVHAYPRKLIPFPGPQEEVDSLYRQDPSFDLWCQGLQEKRIDWIIVRKDGTYVEQDWLENRPDLFQRVYSNSCGEIWGYNSQP